MLHDSNHPIATGKWGDDASWEIYASDVTPPAALITAVACVAIVDTKTNDIVLTRNHRGWEVLAGHIESGETPLEALHREALEEGGFEISKVVPFGYLKTTASKKSSPESRNFNYPFPVSYIAYYLACTENPLAEPTGEEILERRVFSQKEVQQLVNSGDFNMIEQTIITLGIESTHTTI
jgi:8-oxo-dGTP pyrophosphatase MutT (NUDIX family)